MEAYATLHRAALMILVRYLSLGGENESIDETMEALGLDNPNYFYRCRSQLYKAGLLTRDGKITLGSPPPSITASVTPTLTNQDYAEGLRVLSQPQSSELDSDFFGIPGESSLSAAAQIDRMDDSGDKTQRNSPFQIRRKHQIAFLQREFESRWDKQLTEANAKALLVLAEDSAEVVFEALEAASGRDLTGHPFNYVRGILRKQAEKERQARPTSLEPEREPDYYLVAPTPRIAAKEAKLRALGYMEPEED